MAREYDPSETETVVLTGPVVVNRFVTRAGLQTGCTDKNLAGVALYAGKAGEAIAVVIRRTATIETSAAVSVGQECGVAADGRLGGPSATAAVAIPRYAAAGPGQIIECELLPYRGA